MPKQSCTIVGKVIYREGDGVEMTIRPGPCEVETTELDATISWTDGEVHGSAAIPLQQFRHFVDSGALKLH